MKKRNFLLKEKHKTNWSHLMQWMENKYIFIFILYFLFAAITNWQLVLGENHMKWDIWTAEYPNQVLMSDALAGSTFPLWNPLMQYGTPYYAMLGCPVWYPLTLFGAVIGYTPIILALSYVIHVAIGGFGMFLLGKQELSKYNQENIFIPSLAAGLIYCGSGVFLSNAEHIMIFVSAAWIPYVFFFARCYIEKKSIVYGMLSGVVAGMIILGGYPELFYDTFLFLAPYTLYFSYNNEEGVIKNIFVALKKYILICCSTICSSAISLIPFLNVKNLLTRTNGLGQVVGTYDLNVVLSFIFPGVATFANTGEVSMVNYYMSVLAILIVPIIIKKRTENKMFYGGLVFIAFILCLGKTTFFHSILYRFFPMYSDFRFPSINRCIATMFLMLIVVHIIRDIFINKETSDVVKNCKVLFGVMLALASVSGLLGNLLDNQSFFDTTKILNFSKSAYISAMIILVYGLFFYFIQSKLINGEKIKIYFLLVLVFDLSMFHYIEEPITIDAYDTLAYSYDSNVRYAVDSEFEKNKNRNKSVDFSDSLRTVNGQDSQTIVFNKTLSEDGYLSILLDNVQKYKATYLRSIMEQNPEAYFTNDIVSADDIDFNTWAMKGETLPEQIYIENSEIEAEDKIRFDLKEISEEQLDVGEQEQENVVQGDINSGDCKTSRLRIYFEDNSVDYLELKLEFIDSSDNVTDYKGTYLMHHNHGKNYVDIYMPDINITYKCVRIEKTDIKLIDAKLVEVERMKTDKYVDITSFGFNNIEMTVNAPTTGYVTVLQAKYAGWKAYLDGKETPITLVDNCFMGIKLSEGKHDIVMRFIPVDFYIGLIITTIFDLLVIGFVFKEVFKAKHLKWNYGRKI